MDNKKPLIEVHDLTVSYSKKPALWNINFTLQENGIIGIIGPNGSGKSTLLKSIMGLIKIDSGYVKLYGESLNSVRSRISYVPQRETVDWDFPVSVTDVVLMGRYAKIGLLKRIRKIDRDVAHDCLEKVGMSSFANRQISQLSGGQQQRVFLARALAQEAELYLLDEPFAGVDIATEKAIVTLLQEMAKKNKSVVVVHHDLETVSEYFSHLVMLNTRLVACGTVKEVFTPELLRETYGARISAMNEATEAFKRSRIGLNEK